MYADTIEAPASINKAIARRGVGKAAWRQVIENLIYSEKEDLKDLAILQSKLANDKDALRLLNDMQARKTIRIIELNELLRYSDKSSASQG